MTTRPTGNSIDSSRRTSIAWNTLPTSDPSLPSSRRAHQTSLDSSSSTLPNPNLPTTTPNASTSATSLARSSSLSSTHNPLTDSNPPSTTNPTRPGSLRLGSPPPPASFVKRVGFDTFENKDATDFSLTLKSKHKDYTYSRRSRTFLCGTDQNDYSEFALEWLIDELVDDGDEIVCLRVVDKDVAEAAAGGKDEKKYREEAERLLEQIIEKNEDEKAISIVLEFAVGKVHETIQRMIHIYEPVILIVGTRGRSLGGLQGLLPGSVSKYCLQHSPVPVIVVRPSSKRDKKKAKRKADPARRIYKDILQQSGGIIPPALTTSKAGTPVNLSPVEANFPDADKLFITGGGGREGGGEGKGKLGAVEEAQTPSPGTMTPTVKAPEEVKLVSNQQQLGEVNGKLEKAAADETAKTP